MSIKINLEIGHEASLIKTPHPSNFTHNWELFVRGADGHDISPYVEKVVFSLHQDFPRPKRVLKDPPYVVREAGYAAFEVPITIYFKGEGKKLEFKYDLDLVPFKVQKEEYVFPNPSEDFKRRLLKGGGILQGKDSSSSKTSNSSDVKKHKNKDEPKVTNTFKNLFGTPITKSSTKVSPDPKSQMQQHSKISPNSVKSGKAEKSEKVSSSSSSSKDKSEKSEKHKSKHHSPSRERASENKDSRRDKDESNRHDKKKDKSHSKEKSSSKSKSKDKARSPSPKRPSSPPTVKSKPVEPPVATVSDKSSTNSSKKSSKKDKKSSDRDKKESKSKESEKKAEHTKSSKDVGQANNSTKDVLKEKPKHENKIEQPNALTTTNDKKSEKADSERKHKHKKKEKSKDHDREKDLTKEKKSSTKNSNKQNKEESIHAAPSPAKQQKRPDSRKAQHNENTHAQPPASKSSSRAPINHDTSDSDGDSHAPSSKIDSDNSPERRSIKREESSPSPPPPPPPPAPVPEARQSKRDREKPAKNEKKRKRKSKNESDHSPSPSLMEPPQQKLRKEEIKNGETTGSLANTAQNNYDSKSFISPSTPTTDRLTNDYMTELKDLQHKIMTLQDNNDLQQVVEMIAATGQYEITSKTFDFDLCALEPGLIKRLQDFFGATSCS